ncbi:MAG: sigma-70 family RNA polymerase sigma factor [Deltaproteobacteria bacterium]|nr:sigma-70 family RNA polymerase sigma factor [Deltaproteobacteria bacterium]
MKNANDPTPDPQKHEEKRARLAEERAWVEAALDGDNQVFGRLVERYQKRVYALAFGILRNREDAWDVAQEAFVKAYKNLGTFEGSSAFYTWLYRITYNLSLDLLRSKSRRETVDFEEGRAHVSEELGEALQQPEHPSDTVDRRELTEVVQRAMTRLSEKHRAIIVLREIEGLSYEEMAEVLKISKGTVMSRLFHARRNLQTLLRPYLEQGQDVEAGLGFAPQGT